MREIIDSSACVDPARPDRSFVRRPVPGRRFIEWSFGAAANRHRHRPISEQMFLARRIFLRRRDGRAQPLPAKSLFGGSREPIVSMRPPQGAARKGRTTMTQFWTAMVDASWRVYPAVVLALIGTWLIWRGLWAGAAGRPGLLRQGRDAFAWIRAFQFAVAGLALVAIAAAWLWRQPWLLILALGVLGEEMYETSRILTALSSPAARPRVRGRRRIEASASA
jgi:hypothetical protein